MAILPLPSFVAKVSSTAFHCYVSMFSPHLSESGIRCPPPHGWIPSQNLRLRVRTIKTAKRFVPVFLRLGPSALLFATIFLLDLVDAPSVPAGSEVNEHKHLEVGKVSYMEEACDNLLPGLFMFACTSRQAIRVN